MDTLGGNIKIIEYENHGQPLIDKIKSLRVNNKPLAISIKSTKKKKSKHLYIERRIDEIVDEKIINQSKKVFVVCADGGFGKSTLLKNLFYHRDDDIPTILIDIQQTKETNFIDILLDNEITLIKNCNYLNSLKDRLIEGESIKHLEFEVLNALQKDFRGYGLFIIDTFEKIKDIDIVTDINVNKNGQIDKRIKSKTTRFRAYIEGLINILLDTTTFIIAGRNTIEDTQFTLADEDIEELHIYKFDGEDIQSYFQQSLSTLTIGMPSEIIIEEIAILTNGNPMLVGLFAKISKEYQSWEVLDFAEMRRRVSEDERYGLLYYLTDRVLSHLKHRSEIWKLVIPRVITTELEKLIFDNRDMLHNLIDAGLATRGVAKESNRYRLHDDVYRAILNHSSKEYKGTLSSWHDNKDVAELHKHIIEFYQQDEEIAGVNSQFEICHHTVMLKNDFENIYQQSREEFANFVFGSLSLDIDDKLTMCDNFSSWSKAQIDKLIILWQEERDTWLSMMSDRLYSEFKEYARRGEFNFFDIELMQKIASKNEFKNDWSIYDFMGIAYRKQENYEKAIEAYKKSLDINPKKDEAYNNIGNTYGKQGKYEKAIEAYTKSLEINPKDSLAYTNLFELQLTQNKLFDKELELKYIEQFAYQKDTFIVYEMLKIVEDVVNDREIDISSWTQKYKDVGLGDWGWNEIDAWIETIEDDDKRARLIEVVEVFKHHNR